MGKHNARRNPLGSMRLAMLSMTALIATGIATEHGPSPENQAAVLTATVTELPPQAPVTEPAITANDIQQPTAASRPEHPIRPAIASDAPADRKDRPSSQKAGPTGLGLPLTPFEQKTSIPGRTNTPRIHHQSDARDTAAGAKPSAQTAVPPIDLTALLTNISAALNAGAAFAQGLESSSAAPSTEASTPAPSSTESDSADAANPASTTAKNVQMAAPTTDLTSLLTTISSALKVGAALAQGVESGSSILSPGSAALGSGSAALSPGSAALDGGSSIAGTGSAVLGPLAAVLAPLSAAALASS
ncbi:hypothetical protein OG203_17680 [Nocardia sp. NBC_01499]|uniref:hypothetical protein n=1 Tax=Nocardia sp. NBC_01499 TaxID=2903597 RepID=UPI003866968D